MQLDAENKVKVVLRTPSFLLANEEDYESYLFWDLPVLDSQSSSESQSDSEAASEESAAKVGKSKPRSVHFADAHGKPLVLVRHFELSNDDGDDDLSAASSLDSGQGSTDSSPLNQMLSCLVQAITSPSPSHQMKSTKTFYKNHRSNNANKDNCFEPLFPDPLTNFSKLVTEKVREGNIALESVYCRSGNIKGLIRVRNLSFAKNVFVRMTFDEWTTFHDLKADYFPPVKSAHASKETDQFEFTIPIPPHLKPGAVVEFCCGYKCLDQPGEYWDNNGKKNYSLRYRPKLAEALAHGAEDSDERTRRALESVWSEFATWNRNCNTTVVTTTKRRHLVTPVFNYSYRSPANYCVEIPYYW